MRGRSSKRERARERERVGRREGERVRERSRESERSCLDFAIKLLLVMVLPGGLVDNQPFVGGACNALFRGSWVLLWYYW